MAEIVHRVGIHDVSFAPNNLVRHPNFVSAQTDSSGADFWAHLPTWGDLWASNQTLQGLDKRPDYIDSSWWVDRAVERTTPLGHPKSGIDTLKATALTLAYPIPPLSRELTQRWLDACPDSGLIVRWPVYEYRNLPEILRRRNELLGRVSPQVDPSREVLDVHSTNLGLTADQVMDWQDQAPGRRLMVSAGALDERLEQHGLVVRSQQTLIEPLLSRVSVVTLKLDDLKDADGDVSMTRQEIINGVKAGNYNNLYGVMVREFRDRVGADSMQPKVDWMIKVRGKHGPDFLDRFVNYTKEVLVR